MYRSLIDDGGGGHGAEADDVAGPDKRGSTPAGGVNDESSGATHTQVLMQMPVIG